MNPKENQKRIYETALVKAFNSFGITALSSYGITTSKYENEKEIFDTIQSTNTSSTNLLLIVRLVEIEKGHDTFRQQPISLRLNFIT